MSVKEARISDGPWEKADFSSLVNVEPSSAVMKGQQIVVHRKEGQQTLQSTAAIWKAGRSGWLQALGGQHNCFS